MLPKGFKFLTSASLWFRDRIGENLFLIIALGVSGFMLFGVPQVTNLWWPSQTISNWTVWFLLLLFVLGFLYLTTLIRFIWPNCQIMSWILKPAGFINGWLGWLAGKMVRQSENRMGFVLPVLLILIGQLILWGIPIDLDVPYVLFGGFARVSGLWFFLTGVWLLAGKLLGPDRMLHGETLSSRMMSKQSTTDTTDDDVRPRTAWQACGEVLSWMAMMGILVELLWLTACLEFPGASFRLYSIGSVFHFAILWPVVAALVDFLQKVTPVPARLLVAFCFVISLIYTSGNTIRDGSPSRPLAAVAADGDDQPDSADWLSRLEQRMDNMPEGPAVIVAASGGGSRAALFTSLVLQMLAQEAMVDLPEARRMSLSANAVQGTWADHILLISSVSGGSLATARYVWNDGHAPSETVDDLRYTTRSELVDETSQQIHNWAQAAETDAADAEKKGDRVAASAIRKVGERMRQIAAAVDSHRKSPKNPGDESSNPADTQNPDITSLVAAAFSSRIADDMSMDFMAPILRGFSTPGATRGEGLYHFWNQRFGWKQIRQGNHSADGNAAGKQAPGSTDPRPLPLVLFNVSDVDAGRRLIVGFPSIPPGFLAGSPLHRLSSASDFRVERGSDYMPLSVDDFATDPAPDITLSRAVRLSSSFPFGFGVSELSSSSTPPLIMRDDGPTIRGQNKRTVLRMLDGGVVDNTGISSLHAVFESLRIAAAENPIGREARLLDGLRRRGVVILEIDSGAKPAGEAGAKSLFAVATRPLSALNNAVYTNALRTSDQLLIELQESLSDSTEARMIATIQNDPPKLAYGDLTLSFKKEQLIAAVPAVLPPQDADDQPLSVLRFRFTCNHLSETSSDVMTAFALGPRDKAIVTGMFLSEASRWQQEMNEIRQRYQSDIGTDGLNRFAEGDVAALAERLLRKAQSELVRAEARLNLLRQSWGHPPQSPAEKQEVTRLLSQPLALLMAVRAIADPDSSTLARKSVQLEELSKIVTEILQDDSKGIGMVATAATKASDTVATTLDTTGISDIDPRAQYSPSSYIGQSDLSVYRRIDDAIAQAKLAETAQPSNSDLDQQLKKHRSRSRYYDEVKQDEFRVRSKFFEGIRQSKK